MRLRYLAVSLLNFFLAVVEGILALRFLLKLFGANENVGFVGWVYEMSAPLLAPFRGIFPTQVYENRYIFEFSTLFAMLMYLILGMFLVFLINTISAAAHSGDDASEEKVVSRKR